MRYRSTQQVRDTIKRNEPLVSAVEKARSYPAEMMQRNRPRLPEEAEALERLERERGLS